MIPPLPPELGRTGQVDLWRAELDAAGSDPEALSRTLAPEEIARAGRFYFPRDRARFIAARALLRRILALYARRPPESLRFRYSSEGKPSLAEPDLGLEFSVAHSRGLAVYAVTQGRPVGVDVEHVRPEVAFERIAERFFSAGESAALLALPRDQRPAAFFRCWTRKEALLKAWGHGLAFGLHRFSVSCAAGPPQLLATPFDPAEAARWSLSDLEPGPGCVGALAVRGAIAEVRCWQCCHGPPWPRGLQWSEK